jgi:hypothetical protein
MMISALGLREVNSAGVVVRNVSFADYAGSWSAPEAWSYNGVAGWKTKWVAQILVGSNQVSVTIYATYFPTGLQMTSAETYVYAPPNSGLYFFLYLCVPLSQIFLFLSLLSSFFSFSQIWHPYCELPSQAWKHSQV